MDANSTKAHALREVSESRLERWIVAAVAFVAGGLAICYSIAFYGRPPGNPDSWGQFGDYIGGILNPAIGLATAILLVRSLRASRASSETAARQFHLAEIQHRIDMQVRRLDVAISAWETAMEVPYTGPIGLDLEMERVQLDGMIHVREARTGSILTALRNLRYVENLRRAQRYDLVRGAWNDAFNHAANIVVEIGDYCQELDALEPTSTLSQAYKRRVSTAAKQLHLMNQISHDAQVKVTVLQWLGDLGDDPWWSIEDMLPAECVGAVDRVYNDLDALLRLSPGQVDHSKKNLILDAKKELLRRWPACSAYIEERLRHAR